MKKLLAATLSLMLVLTFSACGEKITAPKMKSHRAGTPKVKLK